MPVRWDTLIATLTEPSTLPRVNWPDSHRHFVRHLRSDEDGAELVARLEASPQQVDLDTLVLDLLGRGPMTLERLARVIGCDPKMLSNRLSRLRREGRVQRFGAGVWGSV